MTEDTANAPGCRDIAIITGIVLAAAAAMLAVGLALIGQEDCSGICEVAGLTTLYAGGPVSGVLGVIYGGVHVAWPLDITFWVVVGFWSARVAGTRGWNPWRVGAAIVAAAIVVGLVLSRFVELDIPA